MFKRTKGYVLLVMLVLTGLAGKVHSDTLTFKERRQLAADLRKSRTDFHKAIEGLSEKQFNFRQRKNQPSIKEHVASLLAVEQCLWGHVQSRSQVDEQLEYPKTFSDEELGALTVSGDAFHCTTKEVGSVKQGLRMHRALRQLMLRYVHTSTENVRAHVVPTKVGHLDAYQLMLLNSIYTRYYLKEINALKSKSGFPK